MLFPGKNEFLKLAEKGNLIPIRREILADTETPLTAYQKLTEDHPSNSFILESVEGGEHLGRYSFIGVNPRLTVSVRDHLLTIGDANRRMEKEAPADPLRVLENYLAGFKAVPVPGLPRFTGGMVGYMGFEYITRLEPVPCPSSNDLGLPLLHFMLAEDLVIFDRVRQVIQIVANAHVEGNPLRAYENAAERIARIQALLSKPQAFPTVVFPSSLSDVEFQSNMPKEEYLQMVETGKKYIKQGDIFQFVPSQRFAAPTKATPLQIYRSLRTVNPSPYMFLMQMKDFALVGSSPEIHVRCEDGHAEIRPIAGTRPRGKTPEEDEQLEKELLADQKERAEHLMLVDLARNDMGRVCDFSSVHVSQFMTIERYSHVMHIVSRVLGRVRKGQNAFDLMRATFPAGTVSGAPKIRAMQIIAELERRCRGPYAGALGYFSFNGNLDTCITIRTLVLKDGMAYVQAGGGVVDDSIPENEYQETVNKAKALMKAVALADSFAG
ncbi:MAG: anthranilate synthase component I [Verrucomicrobiae bacterium]|nr:anthranilate synthase component I [Verrucomicrobiae bacterium]